MAKRVLVIEDDPATVLLISYILKEQGYKVLTALNGIEGFRKAVEQEPDLVILDIMMPEVDGFKICRALRREDRTSHLPILMFSAKARQIDKDAGLSAGADDYLTKPADPSEIVSRVDRVLAQSRAGVQR